MTHILSAINVVLPIFITIYIGYLLKQKNIITNDFVTIAMKLVFNLALPCLLFIKVSQSELSALFNTSNAKYLLFCFIGIMVIFLIALALGRKLPRDKQGAFIQGSFRSNFILIGGSILLSMFDQEATEILAVSMVLVIPVFNILAVYVLNKEANNITSVFKKIVTNPLIISIILGIIAAAIKLETPTFLSKTLQNFGSIGTPLGLIGIGSYLDFKKLFTSKEAYLAVGLKIILFPLLFTGASVLLGFNYLQATTIFMLSGSPSAISSFIMAKAMDNDAELAANIVILGTALSLITYIIGLSILAYIY